MRAVVLIGAVILLALLCPRPHEVMCTDSRNDSSWLGQPSALLKGVPEAEAVRLIDPSPVGIVKSDDESLRSISEAIARSFAESGVPEQRPHAGGRNAGPASPTKVKVLAWCIKANILHVPPGVFDEIIVAAYWRDARKWALCYLSRTVSDGSGPDHRWQMPEDADVAGFRWQQEFPREPREQEIVRFVKETSFGNNEFTPNVVVGALFLYDKTMRALESELLRGIDRNEKAKRYNRLVRAVAEPRGRRSRAEK